MFLSLLLEVSDLLGGQVSTAEVGAVHVAYEL